MSKANTIKIFIGNVASDTTSDNLRPLFEKYGEVVECDVLKNYGFVHMTNKNDANKAIAQLDGYSVDNHNIRVELSTGKKGGGGGGGKFDKRGFGGPRRGGPYPPRDFRDMERYPMPVPPYERYDYYRMLMERESLLRMGPLGRPGARDRYPLPLPRDRMGDRYPPDPRDDRLARSFLEERAARLQDSYMRDRDPVSARPPPEYYDRKPALGGLRGGDSMGGAGGRGAAGYGGAGDFLRGMDRSGSLGGAGNGPDFLGRANQGNYNRQNGPMGGGAGGKAGDSQSSFATDAIFF